MRQGNKVMEIKLNLSREELEILIGLLMITYTKEPKYDDARRKIIEQLETFLNREK